MNTPIPGQEKRLSHFQLLFRLAQIKARVTELHHELGGLPHDTTFTEEHVEAVEKLEAAITNMKHGAILPRVKP